MVVSGTHYMALNNGTQHPTGYWAEELVTPYQHFLRAGLQVDLATPGGVVPAADPQSLNPDEFDGDLARVTGLKQALTQMAPLLQNPLALESLQAAPLRHYQAVFFPGGHGPMVDLANHAVLADILLSMLAAGKPIAALCHGPAALLALRNRQTPWPFRGYRMTCFSNAEEAQTAVAGQLPYALESELGELGAILTPGPPWQNTVVIDRQLLTGQNPASAAALADALLARLVHQS